MTMYYPPHRGGIIKRQCLDPLDLSTAKAAAGLGVARQTLSDLVNEHSRVSAEVAIRLFMAFGSPPDVWLRLQMGHDLWQAQECTGNFKVECLNPGLHGDCNTGCSS